MSQWQSTTAIMSSNINDEINQDESAITSTTQQGILGIEEVITAQDIFHHNPDYRRIRKSPIIKKRISNIEDDDNASSGSKHTDENDDGDGEAESDTDSEFSSLTGFSEFSGHEWKPKMKPSLWVQRQMTSGNDPREILSQILPNGSVIPEDLSDRTLWRILANMLSEPPKRQKLRHINTIENVVELLQTCKNIIVLTGAGVSVSCGIPDFRSSDGIYSRLAKDFPSLPDPQAMFDIQYFSRDPRPFFKFAREIYPGQFRPSTCHRFIKMLEDKNKLLRNYTQNIDTLEQVAGIRNVIECHGSFATASCTKCKFKATADTIRDDIFAQRIPMCPKCNEESSVELTSYGSGDENGTSVLYSQLVEKGIMKPDIVFFGEGLPESFHTAITCDKNKCDLLIVIGSSLKVHPVALIPRSIAPNIPQILINRERLNNFNFDVELLGDSDTIITQLCNLLSGDYTKLSEGSTLLKERHLKPSLRNINRMFHETEGADKTLLLGNDDTTDTQLSKSGLASNSSLGGFGDSGFETTSSSIAGSVISTSNKIDSNSDRKYYFDHKGHHRPSSLTLKQGDESGSDSSPLSSGSSPNSVFNLVSEEKPHIPPPDGHSEELQQSVIGDTSEIHNFNIEIARNPGFPRKDSKEQTQLTPKPSSSSRSLESEESSCNSIICPVTLQSAKLSKEALEVGISDHPIEGTYWNHMKSGIYIFPGAQISSFNLNDSSDDDGDDDDDLDIDIESRRPNIESNNSSDVESPFKMEKLLSNEYCDFVLNYSKSIDCDENMKRNSDQVDDCDSPPSKKKFVIS